MPRARLLVLLTGILFAAVTQATPNTDALSQCLSDNTSGKDRKDLAKWIFAGMSMHPEIGVIAKPKPADFDTAQRNMGILVTRLIGDQCADQMKEVIKDDGSDGVRIAFEQLGRVAIMELMSNANVNAAMNGFERYLNKEKLDRVLKSK